jgi:hypothetical protein
MAWRRRSERHPCSQTHDSVDEAVFSAGNLASRLHSAFRYAWTGEIPAGRVLTWP